LRRRQNGPNNRNHLEALSVDLSLEIDRIIHADGLETIFVIEAKQDCAA
jgi:hypothetical protein